MTSTNHAHMAPQSEVTEFLSSRRARITPEQAGLPTYGGSRRRVKGLRREEVAMLAGVSVDYYVRLERGNLAGASESVLEALAEALQLNEVERGHLYSLARAANQGTTRRSRARTQPVTTVRPGIQRVLDAITDAPAWVRNRRFDIIATNWLSRALLSPLFEDSTRPVNTVRFVYLNPAAEDFFPDWGKIAKESAAMLRLEASRNPHDKTLVELVGELSTRSETFRQYWASHDVHLHRTGVKRYQHPMAGRLELDFESMELRADRGLVLNTFTAPPGSPSADALSILTSWAATQEQEHRLDHENRTAE